MICTGSNSFNRMTRFLFSFLVFAHFLVPLYGQTQTSDPAVIAANTAPSPGSAEPAAEPAPAPKPASPQQAATRPRLDIYGFAMLDMGYQFRQNDPDWFDVIRPTKLPAFADEFGRDGHWYSSVRQSRFGVKSFSPTSIGELRTTFEFEMFGVGADAGQTTIRLRHAYGEVGQVGAGQTWSVFMDPDVFPDSVEYWGPSGMVFFRNVQVRWMPIQGDTRLTVAIERPGASADAGIYSERIEIQGINPRFPAPDVTAEFRYGGQKWGYVEAAGIVRKIKWDDVNTTDPFELSGSATGWGINLSSNIKIKRDTVKLQYVYGEGIENYFNDNPVDVGIKLNPGNTVTPFLGEPLPVTGIVAFLDHRWSERFSSSAGYSRVEVDNTDGQLPSAFKTGQYALANLLFRPVPNVMMGGEFQWGERENFSDGFTSEDYRIQFSFKYDFSASIGGN
jgi:hypothetical protein